MCGIVGAMVVGAAPPALRAVVEQAQQKLRHRGPDDAGVYGSAEEHCVLAHTRLSILDLSPAGHQPMQTVDGRFWISFNGEIYNFRDLQKELQQAGESLRSQSDTEVILQLYAREGRACLERLRGMFAFAIWDAQEQELFLARDRLGIKPLYYYADENVFLFASEVRALLATGVVRRAVDEVALWQYLTYQAIPAPRTLIKNVQALPAGSWLQVKRAGEKQSGRYWDLFAQAAPEAKSATFTQSKKKVRELLAESVALHLVSDVPVALFLSGGIDSSALAALVSQAGQTPHTFSVVFNESSHNEAPYARQVARLAGAEHQEIHLTEQGILEQLPDALRAMDQPTGDGINTYVVSQAVHAAGVKVALSGLGGDEFFAGYPSFARLSRSSRYLRHWGALPKFARASAAKVVRLLAGESIASAKLAAVLAGDGTMASMYAPVRQVLLPTQRRALLSAQMLAQVETAPDAYLPELSAALAHTSAGVLAQISYAEARTYMHDVLLRDTDQMSMAHSLEVRVPLLDHKLVEYLMGLPDECKRSNGTPKRLLVESLAGLLPDEIVQRPKQGFALPFDLWMRGALREFCEARLLSKRIGERGIFNTAEVQKLWEAFLAGSRRVSWSRLWILVVIMEWLEGNEIA
ncbi:MAG: asparagine synthase (glutamine-hydrolyzing) [Acidobacteria bacterium]|nr:asparagine synthase (glutamine-hydrolyzing) [Acidobacteriota bacterium]